MPEIEWYLWTFLPLLNDTVIENLCMSNPTNYIATNLILQWNVCLLKKCSLFWISGEHIVQCLSPHLHITFLDILFRNFMCVSKNAMCWVYSVWNVSHWGNVPHNAIKALQNLPIRSLGSVSDGVYRDPLNYCLHSKDVWIGNWCKHICYYRN